LDNPSSTTEQATWSHSIFIMATNHSIPCFKYWQHFKWPSHYLVHKSELQPFTLASVPCALIIFILGESYLSFQVSWALRSNSTGATLRKCIPHWPASDALLDTVLQLDHVINHKPVHMLPTLSNRVVLCKRQAHFVSSHVHWQQFLE